MLTQSNSGGIVTTHCCVAAVIAVVADVADVAEHWNLTLVSCSPSSPNKTYPLVIISISTEGLATTIILFRNVYPFLNMRKLKGKKIGAITGMYQYLVPLIFKWFPNRPKYVIAYARIRKAVTIDFGLYAALPLTASPPARLACCWHFSTLINM